jgi:hypothetical protein
MATSNETGRSAKRSAFAAESQQRIELNAQIAGIAGAFGKVSDLGPPVLALQQALLAGLSRSQEFEAKRLARRHGKSDARVAAAVERAAGYAEVRSEVETQANSAGRVAETLQRDDLFSGYVYGPEGEPAADHKVRVEIVDVANKRQLRGTAKTAVDGYFRMLLGGDNSDGRTPVDVEAKITQVVRAMYGDAGGADDAATAATDTGAAKAKATTPPAPSTVQSRAEVLDPNGRIVYEDPDPPTFEAVGSEFRIYVLDEKSTDGTVPKPKTKRKT